ncbi:histidine phosphatase family protein [uncultured Ferrimonas sp.]|uniref:SixA phosphatase family protein n=1 Tax=uncultured Ferrimonas sp. TaxID=432640 RepID=UPI002619823F|nr:histidine phosphatase family protein [uncultured Ferrimonas sp.]
MRISNQANAGLRCAAAPKLPPKQKELSVPRYALMLPLLLSLCASATAAPYSLYLVRHAEKAVDPAQPKDPSLTACGIQRSAWLAQLLASKQIEAIYSSDYRRTQHTAAPSATAFGLTVQLYHPAKLAALQQLLQQRQQNAMVVGHSNTTPALAGLLSQQQLQPLDEQQFDRLYQLQLDGEQVSLSIIQQDFNCDPTRTD